MSNDNGVRIELAENVTDEVRFLAEELEAVLAAQYPPEQRHGLARRQRGSVATISPSW